MVFRYTSMNLEVTTKPPDPLNIIILLMWLYLTAYVILIGAEVNSSIELQTSADSTVGEDKPMGERNAFVADHTPNDLRR